MRELANKSLKVTPSALRTIGSMRCTAAPDNGTVVAALLAHVQRLGRDAWLKIAADYMNDRILSEREAPAGPGASPADTAGGEWRSLPSRDGQGTLHRRRGVGPVNPDAPAKASERTKAIGRRANQPHKKS